MKLHILLLCNKPAVGNDANTIVDHIEALEKYTSHKVWTLSNIGDLPVKLVLERFDAIIIHYSLALINDYYLSKQAKKAIRNFKGLKIIFVQDEYRKINTLISELNYLKVDVYFTCFPNSEINRIYPISKLPGVNKYNNLTGYIPERLIKMSNQRLTSSRGTHVGYRGRKLPFWYGELAYEKWSIVDRWLQYTEDSGLINNVSYDENDRIYGEDWLDFLTSCKATLGVESGASIMDFTGELEKEIDLYQLMHPTEPFYTVQQKFLLPFEGKYKLNQISPRCFEAIALKTVLVLYEGEYSGILVPDRHYIMLKKDFSNIKEVISKLKDDVFLQNMAELTFQEVALNPIYSYQHFAGYVSDVISSEFSEKGLKRVEIAYEENDFQHDIKCLSWKNKYYKYRRELYQKLPSDMRLLIRGIARPSASVRYIFRHFIAIKGFFSNE